MLHRDVKPSNVLVSAFGEPLLADFGIARVSGGYETSEGLISASIPYAAPEVLEGRPATPAADVYSLATTIYCVITGAPPFRAGPDEAMVSLYLRISKDPVPDLRPMGVPDPLCQVLEAAMAKDLAHRPPTALAFGRNLQAVQRVLGEPVTPMAVTEEVDATLQAAPAVGSAVGSAVASLGQPTGPIGLWSPQPGATSVGPPMVPGGPLGSPVPAAPRRRAGVRGWVALAVAVLLVVAGGVVGTILLWPDKPPPPVPGKPTTGLDLTDPSDLTIGPDGALYVADDGGNKVIRVTSAGVVERVAGTGTSGDSGDGRAATGAELNSPEALAVGPDGSVYIAVSGRIRRVDPAGLIRPVTGFDPSLTANAVEVSADSDGNDTLFVATDDAILMRDPQGTVTTVVSDFPGVRDLLHEPNGSLLASVSNGGINQVVRITTSTDGTGPTETVVAGADADATDASGRRQLPAGRHQALVPGRTCRRPAEPAVFQ